MAKRCGRAAGLKKYRSRTKSGIWNQASENRPRRARPGRTGNLHASASSQADKTDRKSRFGTPKPEIRENTNQVFLPVRIYGKIVCNHNNLNIMKKQADIFIYK